MTNLNLDRLKARVESAIGDRFPRTRVLISPSADDASCLNVLVLNAERVDVAAIKQVVRRLDDEAELLGLSLVPIVKDREITARYYPTDQPSTVWPSALRDYIETELAKSGASEWQQMGVPEESEQVADGGGRCSAGSTACQAATRRAYEREFPDWMFNLELSIQAGDSPEHQSVTLAGTQWESACDAYGCAIGGINPSHEELALAA